MVTPSGVPTRPAAATKRRGAGRGGRPSVRGPARRRPGGLARLVAQLEALYRVGELHGLAAAKVWLTEHGIAWREMTQAPRMPRRARPRQCARRPSTC